MAKEATKRKSFAAKSPTENKVAHDAPSNRLLSNLHLRKRRKKSSANGGSTAQQQPALPNFLDVDHVISAAQFGARRLPEIKSLWRSFLFSPPSKEHGTLQKKDDTDDAAYYRSGGGKKSNRHLRRRTGSHASKKRHRFPRSERKERSVVFECNRTGGDENYSVSATTITTKCIDSNSLNKTISNGNISRKSRRKPALLKLANSAWQRPALTHTKNDTNTKNWLETHRWHAKRFHMSPPLKTTHSNWCIPLAHSNRDTQAALRLATTECTVQDATWTIGGTAIEIRYKVPLSFLLDVEEYDNLDTSTRTKTARHANGDEDVDGLKETILLEKVLVRTMQLDRICGGKEALLKAINEKEILLGKRLGHCMIHDLDCTFPFRPIGPATFLFACGNDKEETEHDDVDNITSSSSSALSRCSILVRIMVHPSILDRVQDVVLQWLSNRTLLSSSSASMKKTIDGQDDRYSFGDDQEQHEYDNQVIIKCSKVQGGTALLQVRGLKATESIVKALKLKNVASESLQKLQLKGEIEQKEKNEFPSLDWNVVSRCNEAHFIIPHGTIIPVELNRLKLDDRHCDDRFLRKCSEGVNDDGKEEDKLRQYLDEVQDEIESKIGDIEHSIIHNITRSYLRINHNSSNIFLIAHCPNNIDNHNHKIKLSCPNTPISGWDILCPPNLTQDIFQSLTLSGKASPIGFVEDARFCLEADPPIPLWPRDYPDTEVGEEYWSGTNVEWNMIRYCVEEGSFGGRICTGLNRWIQRCYMVLHGYGSVLHHEGKNTRKDKLKGLPSADNNHRESPRSLNDWTSAKYKGNSDNVGNRIARIQWDNLAKNAENELDEEKNGYNVMNNNDEDDDDERKPKSSVIMVQGEFLAPFQQAIIGLAADFLKPKCCYSDQKRGTDEEENNEDTTVKKKQRTRPHRKIRAPHETIIVPPLHKAAAESHQQMCSVLLSSLALPALIRCHLIMEGKGILRCGMSIEEYMNEECSSPFCRDLVNSFGNNKAMDPAGSKTVATLNSVDKGRSKYTLGYVIAGAFSPCRGKHHGLGIIGSSRLLTYLVKGNRGTCVVSKRPCGNIQVKVRVVIHNRIHGCSPRVASLTLLA